MEKRWFLLVLLVVFLFNIQDVSAGRCDDICDGDKLIERVNFFFFCLVVDEKSCDDCSCSCGNYNRDEALFCNDGRDNDCNGFIDNADFACKIEPEPTCVEDGLCKPNCAGGDVDCLCREENGYLCNEGEVCSNSILSKDLGVCCTTICSKEASCGFDGLCKENCESGDPDCSCEQQKGFLCKGNEVCNKELVSSDVSICCGERCQSCNEYWVCSDWKVCKDGKQTRECIDNNQCGTTFNEPVKTKQCFSTCEELWVCDPYSSCVNGQRARNCKDYNNCGTALKKPAITESCTVSCSELNGFKCLEGQVCEGNLLESSDGACCNIQCSDYKCAEDWQCPGWETIFCPKTGIRSRTCVDLNDCKIQGRKTYSNIPQLTQECAYVSTCDNSIKDASESDVDCGSSCGSTCIKGQKCNSNSDCTSSKCVGGICFCEEDWECTEWSECPAHEIQIRSCSDKSKCGTTDNRPEVTRECEYTATLAEDKGEEILGGAKQGVAEKETASVGYKSVIDNRGKSTTDLILEKNYNQALILLFLVFTLIVLIIFLRGKGKPTIFLSLFFTVLAIIALVIYLNIKVGGRSIPYFLLVVPLLYILALSFVYYTYKTKKTFIIIFLNSYPIFKKLLFTDVYDVPDVDQLRDYVAESLRRDKSLSEIKSKLSSTGWPKYLINKAFQNISIVEGKESRLSDVILSVMRLSTRVENMVINALLEKDGLTENSLMNKLDIDREQLASVLNSLNSRNIIDIRGNKIYFNKSLKTQKGL